MSTGLGLTTILECLKSGEREMGLNPADWQVGSDNKGQKLFAAKQFGWRTGLRFFKKEALRGFATTVHQELVDKMVEWKMRIQPPPDLGFTAVYMIAQLKESLKWAKTGERYYRRDADWPEFLLKEAMFFRFGPGERDLVAVVKTREDDTAEGDTVEGDTVYMMPYTGDVLEGMKLVEAIEAIEAAMKPEFSPKYKGVVPPCIKAMIDVSLDWLLGMINDGNFIAYAKQRIEFGMNEKGFAVREETVIGTLRTCAPRVELKPFILSPNGEPFLFWRRRPGVEFPISMFQFTKDHFADPGNLDDIVK